MPKRPKLSPEALHDCFAAWAASYPWHTSADTLPDAQAALIADLDGLAENRRALGNPMLTEAAAKQLFRRLVVLSDGCYPKIPVMRYCLQTSILQNWLSVYPVKDWADFRRWAGYEATAQSAPCTVADPEGVEEW